MELTAYFEHAMRDFFFLWATIDPIGTLVIFAALTKSMPTERKKQTAKKAILYSFIVLLGAIVAGQLILSGMGIRMLSFQVAGGLILLLFAMQMIFSNFSGENSEAESGHDIAVFPLAIPAIATPGAIMAAIILTDNNVYTLLQQLITAAVLVLILGIAYFMMLGADRILKVIGQNGALILIKVMGMLLAGLSVELIMEAIGIDGWLGPAE